MQRQQIGDSDRPLGGTQLLVLRDSFDREKEKVSERAFLCASRSEVEEIVTS